MLLLRECCYSLWIMLAGLPLKGVAGCCGSTRSPLPAASNRNSCARHFWSQKSTCEFNCIKVHLRPCKADSDALAQQGFLWSMSQMRTSLAPSFEPAKFHENKRRPSSGLGLQKLARAVRSTEDTEKGKDAAWLSLLWSVSSLSCWAGIHGQGPRVAAAFERTASSRLL